MAMARMMISAAAVLVAIGLMQPVLSQGQPSKPFRTLADRSNLNSAVTAHRFSIGDNKSPVFTWAPNHTGVNENQTAYQVVVSQSHDEVVWDSGVVTSGIPKATYTGSPLKGRRFYTWVVRFWDSKNQASPWSEPAEFHFGENIDKPTWLVGQDKDNLFRAKFKVAAGVTRVTLYVCGLGYSYASVNGKTASDQLLTTAPWSNNERRSAYSTIDITNLTTTTAVNVLGVALGNGWRDTTSFPRLDTNETSYDATFQTFWAQIITTSSSGKKSTIVDTAYTEFSSGRGPVVKDSVYNGETYDARLEQPGWDTLAFQPYVAWVDAKKNNDAPRGTLAPWVAAPVTLDRVIKPVAINESYPGIFVVDFGVNVAGVCKLSGIKLAKGKNVTMRHGEIMQHALLPDLKTVDPKLIYTGNLRSALATDVYISKGDTMGETFYPRFTYHGFRFVQITGLTSLTMDQIELHHFHSAVETKTETNFKNPIISKIMKMAIGAQQSNMMTVQTDCDQRDERLGWMGDANLSGDSLVVNFQYGAFLMSFLKTMIDELNFDGSSVDVSPNVRYGGRPGDISWTTATIAFPYAAFKGDGDTGPAKMYINQLMLQINNIKMQCKGNADENCPTKYGDWVPPNPPGKGQGPKPSKPFTSAFSYVDAVGKVAELAKAIGNTTLANELDAEHTRLSATFNKAFANTNGTYDNGLMTTYTLPLHLGIVPADTKAAVQKNLLDQVTTQFKDHNMCGIIGMKFLFEQLAAMGRADAALAVLEETSYPSIAFMAYNSYEKATENLWELWDAYTEGVGMNSRNHHMFSSYSKYVVENIAGLTQETNHLGDHTIVLKPAQALGVSSADVTSKLNHGDVKMAWERNGGLQCAKAPEGEVATLSCGQHGGVIKAVRFASFGKPFGSCGSFGVDNMCHTSVTSVVNETCVGKNSCTIESSTQNLGTACANDGSGQLHRLYVEVECDTPVAVHASVSVPVSSAATMFIPTTGMMAPHFSALHTNYNTTLALDANGKEHFVIAFGSGVHEFSLSSTAPTVVIDATHVENTLSLACPDNHHVNHVRFASLGNPVQSSSTVGDVVHNRGACHVGSVVADVEHMCLGKQTCDVVVDVARVSTFTDCVSHMSTMAAQAECAVNMVTHHQLLSTM